MYGKNAKVNIDSERWINDVERLYVDGRRNVVETRGIL